jgi:MtrB/PioB family decaheme-associated outer membrane protein
MKIRSELLVTCAALVIGMGMASPALAADMFTKAPAAAAPVAPPWWYDGFAELGGRFFLNNPNYKDLGKFYEYRDLRPGVFGNFYIGAHRTNDPLDIVAWGKNIGWNDQAFGLEVAKPGQVYVFGGWDETPHVFTNDAKTLYNGVGTTNLTVPNSVRTALSTSLSGAGGVVGLPTAASQSIIDANSHTTDIKYRRDTASAGARWTPTDNWDFNLDYSHMHREGTEPLGAVSFSPGANANAATRSTFEIPRPVDDVTQNAHLKGEYAGSAPWGKPFNIALGGGFSDYKNSDDAVVFQNPWNAVNTGLRPLNNLYSLPPDNKATSVNVSGGVGLPWNSRYMGTFQYTKMTSDASNLPFSINPFVLSLSNPPLPNPLFANPSRETTTTLFNNVLNTQIASDLKSTLRYRYYRYDANNMPAIIFDPRPPNPDSTSGYPDEESAIRYPSDYTKQNGSAQLAWHAMKWLTVGATYDWERWDRTYRETGVTNENTGKAFADAKWGWSILRASLQFGERRYDQYTALADDSNNAAYRMRDLANRDRTKAMVSWAVDVTHELTVTPNAGYLNDDYQTNIVFVAPAGEAGVKKVRSWNAGVDASLNLSRSVALFASYNYENGYRQIYENSGLPDLNIETTDRNNTFIVGSKVTLIPNKLFVDGNFTYARSTSQWDLSCTPAGCRYGPPLATFPDSHNTLTRLDVQAKYMLDDSIMHSAGWAGKAYVKARVLWEKNSNDSWQSLQNQMGWLVNPTNTTTAYSIWTGSGNPNYTAVVGQVSFGLKW